MKKILLIFMFWTVLSYAEQYRFGLNQFNGGLFDTFSSDVIPDNCSSDLLNVYIDKDIGIVKRKGFIKYNTVAISSSPIKQLYRYFKGLDYMIANTSTSIQYSQNGTFSDIVNNLSSEEWSFESWLTDLIGNNIVDTPFSWNGSTYTVQTSIPNGSITCLYADRYWIAGIPDNKSLIYYSAQFSYTSFNTVDDYEYVGRDDGDIITALYVYNGNMYIFKRKTIWVFVGTDPTTATGMQKQLVTKEVGCVDKNSIQEFQRYLIFLSERGLERFDGNSVEKISDKIDTTMSKVRQLKSKNNYWLTTFNTDWNNGTKNGFGISNGSLFLISTTTMENVVTAGSQGNNTGMSLDNSGNPYLAYTSGGNTLYVASFTPSIGWSTKYIDSVTVSGKIGIRVDNNNIYLVYIVVDAMVFTSYTASTNLISKTTFAVAPYVYREPSLNLDKGNNPCISFREQTTQNLYFTSFTPLIGWTSQQVDGSVDIVGLDSSLDIDNKNVPHIIYWSQTDSIIYYTSYTVNKGWSKVIVSTLANVSSNANYRISLKVDANGKRHVAYVYNEGGSTYYIYYASNTNGLDWWSITKIASMPDTNNYPSISVDARFNPHITYCDATANKVIYASYTVTTNFWSTNTLVATGIDGTYTNIIIDSETVHIGYYDSTNTDLKYWTIPGLENWTSNIKNVGNNATVWKTFNYFHTQRNSNINYYLKLATASEIIDNEDWLSVTQGQLINSTTFPYIKQRVTATRSVGDSVEIKATLVNWVEGSSFTPVSSLIYNDRYYLSVSTGSDQNSIIIVLDKYWNYTILDIPAESMVLYNNKWYTGTSRNNGYIYEQDTGYNDDGVIINSYYNTKSFDFGNSDLEKIYKTLYITTKTTTSVLNVSYFIDESTTSKGNYNVGLSSASLKNISTEKIPVAHAEKGRYIKFKISHNQLDKNFNFRGLRCYYDLDTLR